MKLGVCYYPEQWPESVWADDARRMRVMGLSRVRIGEFAWSRIEPDPGRFEWAWLDRAIATLHEAGLSWQKSRTWCQTGVVMRRRKPGTVTLVDPDAAVKRG